MFNAELVVLLHPVLGSCVFLGLTKIHVNQIRSTYVICNKKRNCEGMNINVFSKDVSQI